MTPPKVWRTRHRQPFRSKHAARCVAGKKQDRSRDFVGFSEASDRNQLAGAYDIVAKLRFGPPGIFGLAHAPKVGRLDRAGLTALTRMRPPRGRSIGALPLVARHSEFSYSRAAESSMSASQLEPKTTELFSVSMIQVIG